MNKLILTALTFLFSTFAYSQPGFEIELNIENCDAPYVMLAYHFGDKQYIVGENSVNHEYPNQGDGTFLLKGEEKLEPGIYLIVIAPENNYFEFIVPEDDQTMKLSTSIDQLGDVTVAGSEVNELFFKINNFNQQCREEAVAHQNLLKDPGASEQELATAKAALNALDAKVRDYSDQQLQDKKGSLYYKIFSAMKEPELPSETPSGYTKFGEDWKYYYYRDHYWDYWDFTEEALVRTPVIHNKLTQFIDKLTVQHPDSLYRWATYVIDKAKVNDEQFKYITISLINKYATSRIVGFDAVYAKLVKRYYETGEAFWSDSENTGKMVDRANKIMPTILGAKAPNFSIAKLNDLNSNFTLHNYSSTYTILYFVELSCGHCKTEIPKLNDWLASSPAADNVSLVRLWIVDKMRDTELGYIKNFTNNYQLKSTDLVLNQATQQNILDRYDLVSTPKLFILDQNKTILFKQIGVEQLDQVFEDF